MGIAHLAGAHLGTLAIAIGAAARADRIANPRHSQALLMTRMTATLVGRHTVAMIAGILADGHTFLKLFIPLIAIVAQAFSRLQTTTIGTILHTNWFTCRLRAIHETMASQAFTLIRCHTFSVHAGLTALRLTVTVILTTYITLSTQTHVGQKAFSRGSTIIALRHTLAAKTRNAGTSRYFLS